MNVKRELAAIALLIAAAFLALQLLFAGFDRVMKIDTQRQHGMRRK